MVLILTFENANDEVKSFAKDGNVKELKRCIDGYIRRVKTMDIEMNIYADIDKNTDSILRLLYVVDDDYLQCLDNYSTKVREIFRIVSILRHFNITVTSAIVDVRCNRGNL